MKRSCVQRFLRRRSLYGRCYWRRPHRSPGRRSLYGRCYWCYWRRPHRSPGSGIPACLLPRLFAPGKVHMENFRSLELSLQGAKSFGREKSIIRSSISVTMHCSLTMATKPGPLQAGNLETLSKLAHVHVLRPTQPSVFSKKGSELSKLKWAELTECRLRA